MSCYMATKMYLSDIRYTWPFTNGLEDKEIYTSWVEEEDASDVWRISIPPPMDGFTYLGFRYLPVNNEANEPSFELVHGMTEKRVFKWVEPVTIQKGKWTPFPFPILHRIIALTEDGIEILIKHPPGDIEWGKVELLAQKLDDFPVTEGLSYGFVDTIANKVTMVLTHDQMMLVPFNDRWTKRIKLLPPISRVLDPFRAEWCDRAIYWNGVDLKRAF